MNRLKIGIIIAGAEGYETVLRAFENPGLQELCTAIAYGNKDEALACRKSLDIQTNFLCIQNMDEVADNRLNLYQLSGEGVSAETVAAQALEDKQIDALVVCRGEGTSAGNGLEVLLTDNICMYVADSLDVSDLQNFRRTLERDFGCCGPRIAILADDRQTVSALEAQIDESKLINYGVYGFDAFFDDEVYRCFDGAVTVQKTQAEEWFRKMSEEYGVRCVTVGGRLVPCTTHAVAKDRDAAVADLCHAIYIAIDIVRSQHDYDVAHVNPLQKMYHDKREDNRKNIE